LANPTDIGVDLPIHAEHFDFRLFFLKPMLTDRRARERSGVKFARSLVLSGLYGHMFHGKAAWLVTNCCLSSMSGLTLTSWLPYF